MSLQPDQKIIPFARPALARTILQAADPAVLLQIGAPGVGGVIWQRDPMPEFCDWIGSLAAMRLPQISTLLAAGAAEDCVQAACSRAGTPPGRMRDILASDIAALAFIMAETMRCSLLHLRLTAVASGACGQFQIENLPARMLCTYRGAGTELAPPGQERPALRMAAGSVAILRGALWPGREKAGLLHRPRPASGVDKTHLLLTIDPATDRPAQGTIH